MRKVPKLRFKEFTDEWEEKKLEEYLVEYKEKVSYTTKLPVLTSSRKGLMFQNRYYDNRELKNETEYGLLPRGYFTYRHMSDDLIFKFNINNIVEYGVVSKEYPIFTTKNLNSWFLYYILNYGDSFKKFAIEQKQGGTRTRLYFKKLLTFAPKIASLQEQEKIANFLSSIDKKISLIEEKLELFREYKKGVMQKIFSQKLRFKDSNGNDYPEWEEKRLGDIGEIIMGQSPNSNNYNEKKIGLPLIQGNADCKNRKVYPRLYTSEITKESLPNDIIMTVRAPVGAIALSNIHSCIGRGVCAIRNTNNFIYHCLIKLENSWEKISQGSTFTAVNSNDIKKLQLIIPSSLEEQEKIADFLSSIDSKIENIEKELERLKKFKRGLLQQMFV